MGAAPCVVGEASVARVARIERSEIRDSRVVPWKSRISLRSIRATDPIGLMLRSAAQQRVSKHGAAPSFETRPLGAPQDEAEKVRRMLLRLPQHPHVVLVAAERVAAPGPAAAAARRRLSRRLAVFEEVVDR